MNILAIDTSTTIASVAVLNTSGKIFTVVSEKQKSHSEVVNEYVDSCLKQAQLELNDIDIFAAGIGPGSFTGIRVGTNAVKALAYSFQKPVVAVDSLAILAEQAQKYQQNLPILCIINAHKNMVYTSLFSNKNNDLICELGPTAIPVKELKDHISHDVFVVGDGWETYHEYFPQELKDKMTFDSQFTHHYPLAETLAWIAQREARLNKTLDWNSFTPLYIRASEAEETRKGILITPLK